MEPRHRAIAKIALSAAGAHGFALAGGYAIREHGMGQRPSGDVDLFTNWHQRADFPAAVNAVVAALTNVGYSVTTAASGDVHRARTDREKEELRIDSTLRGSSVPQSVPRVGW